MLNLSNKLLNAPVHINTPIYSGLTGFARKNQMFEHAVQKLDSLLLNRKDWERVQHAHREWIEWDHDPTDQYVNVGREVNQENVVICARIAHIAIKRLHVNWDEKTMIVRKGEFLHTIKLDDLQNNQFFSGIAIQTAPQTDPALIHAIVAEVTKAACAVA